ncbi:Alginate biosynthesis sensor protein kinB [Brevundimonas vesicularis]|uniref:histidine kinase n=1 Tax=Brevundimonas vesicularis TaxID=41276 RepID=A0A2X1B5R3_BREVE|nr:HAMP domain-containing sensor histidine kinase [Brevundimonas vesicularis]SPU52187.1 Alginate biosynthesis sensor protein kinB [Brevundimonas vesicularis]
MIVSRALNADEPRTTSVKGVMEVGYRPGPGDADGPDGPNPLIPVLTGVAVAILVAMAIAYTRSAGLVAGLWGASGVAVAVWLRTSRGRTSDLIFGGVMTVSILIGEIIAGNNPPLALAFTITNMIEIVGAVLLARRFSPTLNLSSLNGAVSFLIFAAVLAPIPAALCSVLILSQIGQTEIVWQGFQTWWLGHTLGIAVLGSLGMSLTPAMFARLLKPRKLIEAAVLIGLVPVFYYVAFTGDVPMGFVLLPLLLGIAVRLGVAGTAFTLVVMSVLLVGSAMIGNGPYVQGDLTHQVLMAQMLVLIGYMPVLLVASLLEERDLLAERARLGRERAEKASEAKSRLLANVAHEIKSPVAGIIGIGDLWRQGHLGPVSAQQAEMSDMLVKTARQVETLAHDLLDVARAESGAVRVDLRPTDIPGLLEDVRRTCLLWPDADRVAVEVVCEGDGLIAVADSQRLAQIITNLTSNALKYGGSGGRVVLRALRQDDCVRIEVSDFGPGLSLQKQAQLFEPFNRLGLERSTVEGHGVGLALAKRLIELQGGSIGVISAPGEGATFWVALPKA